MQLAICQPRDDIGAAMSINTATAIHGERGNRFAAIVQMGLRPQGIKKQETEIMSVVGARQRDDRHTEDTSSQVDRQMARASQTCCWSNRRMARASTRQTHVPPRALCQAPSLLQIDRSPEVGGCSQLTPKEAARPRSGWLKPTHTEGGGSLLPLARTGESGSGITAGNAMGNL